MTKRMPNITQRIKENYEIPEEVVDIEVINEFPYFDNFLLTPVSYSLYTNDSEGNDTNLQFDNIENTTLISGMFLKRSLLFEMRNTKLFCLSW